MNIPAPRVAAPAPLSFFTAHHRHHIRYTVLHAGPGGVRVLREEGVIDDRAPGGFKAQTTHRPVWTLEGFAQLYRTRVA